METNATKELDWDDLHLMEKIDADDIPEKYMTAYTCAKSLRIIGKSSIPLLILLLNDFSIDLMREQLSQIKSDTTLAEYLYEAIEPTKLEEFGEALMVIAMADAMDDIMKQMMKET